MSWGNLGDMDVHKKCVYLCRSAPGIYVPTPTCKEDLWACKKKTDILIIRR